MPIPENVYYARVNFTLELNGAPAETAAIGFHGLRRHFTGNTVDPAHDTQAMAESIRDKWISDLDPLRTRTGSNCIGVNVEVYAQTTANRALAKGVAPFDATHAWAGAEAAVLPYQCALCVSLYAYTPGQFTQDGKSKRGRLYLPAIGASRVSNDGVYTPSNRDALLTALGTFFNDVQGAHFPGVLPDQDADYWDLSILSVARATVYPITQVGLGEIIDTQRRRRRSLPENRTWTAVAHS